MVIRLVQEALDHCIADSKATLDIKQAVNERLQAERKKHLQVAFLLI